MSRKLKLGAVLEEKPVRMTVELTAETHRLLLAYAEAHARENGHAIEPARLVGPIVARFIASDRGFVRGRGRA